MLLVDPQADLAVWDLPIFYFHAPLHPVLPPVGIRNDWRAVSVAVRQRLQHKLGNSNFRLDEFAFQPGISVRGPSGALGVYCVDEISVNGERCEESALRVLRGEAWRVDGGDQHSLFLVVFSDYNLLCSIPSATERGKRFQEN